MLDIKFIRENPEIVEKGAKDKGIKIDINQVLDSDKTYRKLSESVQKLREERNTLNEQIKKNPNQWDKEGAQSLKQKLEKEEQNLRSSKEKLDDLLLKIPNPSLKDVSIGDESKNKIIKKVGSPKKFDFTPYDHLELGETLDIIDVKRAAKVSGTRFGYLKNEAALLEFALVQFAMEKLLKEGFTPIIPPTLIKQEVTSGLGYWQAGGHEDYYLVFDPVCRSCGVDLGSLNLLKILGKEKFERDLEALHISEVSIKHFQENNIPINPQYIDVVKNCLNCGADLTSVYLYLIGTAEHSIVPMHKNETLSKKELPKRYVGFSTSFRREAGSYGKDTRGIFRVHQFDKVEMVSFVAEDDDDKEHEYLLSLQEKLWQALEIPYQVVKMCTGDLGFPVARKYDIEAWIPSQNKYREVTSVSTTTDFQARRLNVKYQDGGEKKYVHILNGTAFAIGRTIIAILENYQQKDGSIMIPKVLQKYCGFSKIPRGS